MAVKERIFLFHGNDSHGSGLAVRRWERLFRQKYGDATCYRIEADELDAVQLSRQLGMALAAQSLFPQPTLCLVRRPTRQETGRGGGHTQALLKALTEVVSRADDSVTFAIWEEKSLTEKHPLVTWFSDHAGRRQAAVKDHAVANFRQFGPAAAAYLQEHGYRLESAAARWLEEGAKRQEKEQRLVKRLKANDPLREDARSWWLHNILDTAMLLAPHDRIEVAVLEQCEELAETPVGVFEIMNAIEREQWSLARSLADVELISKNGLLPHAWIVDQLITSLASFGRESRPICAPRTLWLATALRS